MPSDSLKLLTVGRNSPLNKNNNKFCIAAKIGLKRIVVSSQVGLIKTQIETLQTVEATKLTI